MKRNKNNDGSVPSTNKIKLNLHGKNRLISMLPEYDSLETLFSHHRHSQVTDVSSITFVVRRSNGFTATRRHFHGENKSSSPNTNDRTNPTDNVSAASGFDATANTRYILSTHEWYPLASKSNLFLLWILYCCCYARHTYAEVSV